MYNSLSLTTPINPVFGPLVKALETNDKDFCEKFYNTYSELERISKEMDEKIAPIPFDELMTRCKGKSVCEWLLSLPNPELGWIWNFIIANQYTVFELVEAGVKRGWKIDLPICVMKFMQKSEVCFYKYCELLETYQPQDQINRWTNVSLITERVKESTQPEQVYAFATYCNLFSTIKEIKRICYSHIALLDLTSIEIARNKSARELARDFGTARQRWLVELYDARCFQLQEVLKKALPLDDNVITHILAPMVDINVDYEYVESNRSSKEEDNLFPTINHINMMDMPTRREEDPFGLLPLMIRRSDVR